MFNLFIQTPRTIWISNDKLNRSRKFQLPRTVPTDFRWSKGVTSKPFFYVYNDLLMNTYRSGVWYYNIKLVYTLFSKLGSFNKLKFFTLRAFLSIILLNSTSLLKLKFTYWLRWVNISKHRRFVNTLLLNLTKIFLLFQSMEYKNQLTIVTKGKLGIRGNNKKKKTIYPFTTNLKNFSNSYYYQDGCGSSSNHGHTFLRIKYKIC